MEYIELKYQDKIVGFACLYGNYVDAFYILPKYRRKNIGSKLVKELYKEYNFKTLHIINNNTPAIYFWKKNFKLKQLQTNFCDTLYEIIDCIEENKND